MILRAIFLMLALTVPDCSAGSAWTTPDIVVATDGSGRFTNIQAAIECIPVTNRERTIVFVKNGTYREKIRVDAPFVTLRGESRSGVRIEFSQLNDDFTRRPDRLGRAVINLSESASDFVLENLTAENTAGQIGPHAFTIYGKADRTVIMSCDVLSDGADTVSLWRGDSGRYYHANCSMRGSVDFVCPRGWCYATNCTFYEMKATAAMWHDGSKNRDMKFVLRDCHFDGTNSWNLARHHHDAQFYFLNCMFASTMNDRAPFRVIYPLDGSEPSAADTRRNRQLDASNIWGERYYFWNCHREGGDYAWLTNNLGTAENSPTAETITATWTFAGDWNPEKLTGPTILKIDRNGSQITVAFDESVTVKGTPRVRTTDGSFADYVSGSGSAQLLFQQRSGKESSCAAIDLNGGAIIATEAAATLRPADLKLPAKL